MGFTGTGEQSGATAVGTHWHVAFWSRGDAFGSLDADAAFIPRGAPFILHYLIWRVHHYSSSFDFWVTVVHSCSAKRALCPQV